MAKPKNLNHKGSEYIEENLFKENPEGLSTGGTVPEEGEVVIVSSMPKVKKVRFLNGRDPGFPLEFHYHSKTHPLKHYVLYDGKEYDLTEEIIEHLESRSINEYAYRTGVNGLPEMYTKSFKYLFRCQPVRNAY